MSQDVEERGVEAGRPIVVCRRSEFVLEAKLIEKCAQPRVVVRGKAWMGAERIWNLGQRLAKMGGDKLLVRNIVRHLAKAVHVVGKCNEAGLDLVLGQDPERMAHHARAGDLAKSSDMRQTGRPVAGLEQHLGLAGCLDSRQDFARFLEWPGIGLTEGIGDGIRGRRCGERLYGGTHSISLKTREVRCISPIRRDLTFPLVSRRQNERFSATVTALRIYVSPRGRFSPW